MGAWGTGLYQDDIAMEVREYYQELLKKGISNEESLDCVLEAFEEVLEDADDAPPFWFGLADTQWKLGRLTDEVREQALALLSSGADLARWEGQRRARKMREKRCCRHCRASAVAPAAGKEDSSPAPIPYRLEIRGPLCNAALRRNRESQWFGWSVFAVS
ncbi:MAG: hypothetical protein V8S89_03880 [Oscillospiraceae bacterium]